MRYRLMASYLGASYQAAVGPSDRDVTLFAAPPPPEEHGFSPAPGGIWRKQVRLDDLNGLWESRPIGSYHGEPCLVLDDLGDRLHIVYLGMDGRRAAQLGYWEVDRGVFEVVVPRHDVTDLAEERHEFPIAMLLSTLPRALSAGDSSAGSTGTGGNASGVSGIGVSGAGSANGTGTGGQGAGGPAQNAQFPAGRGQYGQPQRAPAQLAQAQPGPGQYGQRPAGPGQVGQPPSGVAAWTGQPARGAYQLPALPAAPVQAAPQPGQRPAIAQLAPGGQYAAEPGNQQYGFSAGYQGAPAGTAQPGMNQPGIGQYGGGQNGGGQDGTQQALSGTGMPAAASLNGPSGYQGIQQQALGLPQLSGNQLSGNQFPGNQLPGNQQPPGLQQAAGSMPFAAPQQAAQQYAGPPQLPPAQQQPAQQLAPQTQQIPQGATALQPTTGPQPLAGAQQQTQPPPPAATSWHGSPVPDGNGTWYYQPAGQPVTGHQVAGNGFGQPDHSRAQLAAAAGLTAAPQYVQPPQPTFATGYQQPQQPAFPSQQPQSGAADQAAQAQAAQAQAAQAVQAAQAQAAQAQAAHAQAAQAQAAQAQAAQAAQAVQAQAGQPLLTVQPPAAHQVSQINQLPQVARSQLSPPVQYAPPAVQPPGQLPAAQTQIAAPLLPISPAPAGTEQGTAAAVSVPEIQVTPPGQAAFGQPAAQATTGPLAMQPMTAPPMPSQQLPAQQLPAQVQPMTTPWAPEPADVRSTGPLDSPSAVPVAERPAQAHSGLGPVGALSKLTGAVRGRRAARKPRLAMSAIFADLVDTADISRTAYAVDEEVIGAMCLFKTDNGYEVFSCAEDARHEVRFFEEEESAYFYLFGVLTAEALRNGRLAPRKG